MNEFKANLWKYGVTFKPGPLHNFTDCEADVILTHGATGESKRFHGTFYNPNYEKGMVEWAQTFGIRGE